MVFYPQYSRTFCVKGCQETIVPLEPSQVCVQHTVDLDQDNLVGFTAFSGSGTFSGIGFSGDYLPGYPDIEALKTTMAQHAGQGGTIIVTSPINDTMVFDTIIFEVVGGTILVCGFVNEASTQATQDIFTSGPFSFEVCFNGPVLTSTLPQTLELNFLDGADSSDGEAVSAYMNGPDPLVRESLYATIGALSQGETTNLTLDGGNPPIPNAKLIAFQTRPNSLFANNIFLSNNGAVDPLSGIPVPLTIVAGV